MKGFFFFVWKPHHLYYLQEVFQSRHWAVNYNFRNILPASHPMAKDSPSSSLRNTSSVIWCFTGLCLDVLCSFTQWKGHNVSVCLCTHTYTYLTSNKFKSHPTGVSLWNQNIMTVNHNNAWFLNVHVFWHVCVFISYLSLPMKKVSRWLIVN